MITRQCPSFARGDEQRAGAQIEEGAGKPVFRVKMSVAEVLADMVLHVTIA